MFKYFCNQHVFSLYQVDAESHSYLRYKWITHLWPPLRVFFVGDFALQHMCWCTVDESKLLTDCGLQRQCVRLDHTLSKLKSHQHMLPVETSQFWGSVIVFPKWERAWEGGTQAGRLWLSVNERKSQTEGWTLLWPTWAVCGLKWDRLARLQL